MTADIDIDFADRDRALALIRHVPARQTVNSHDRRHLSGIYVCDIPRDPVLGCATIDYHAAQQRGYFKLDFLNMSVYQSVRDPDHYRQLLAQQPAWDMLWTNSALTAQLVHVGNRLDLLNTMRPDSIPRLAAFISIMRPGKAHLQGQAWDQVFDTVWDGDSSRGYTFKKSHAVSYSMLVTLHMNLLTEHSSS